MNKKQCEALKWCTGVDKPVRFKYKGKSDKYLVGTVEDEVSVIASCLITLSLRRMTEDKTP